MNDNMITDIAMEYIHGRMKKITKANLEKTLFLKYGIKKDLTEYEEYLLTSKIQELKYKF